MSVFTKEHIKEIADIIFPLSDESVLLEYKDLLKLAGYMHRSQLEQASVKEFAQKEFGEIGTATTFYYLLTWKRIGDGKQINIEQIKEIIDLIFQNE